MLLVGVAIGGCGGSRHTHQASTSGGGSPSVTTGARTSLRIVYRSHRLVASTQHVWTLTCEPTGGDHPHPSTACAELSVHAQILVGGGRGRISCGVVLANGPSVVVTGTVDGHAVHYSPVSICNLGWSELGVLLTGTTNQTKSS